jgi:hypothetical protein
MVVRFQVLTAAGMMFRIVVWDLIALLRPAGNVFLEEIWFVKKVKAAHKKLAYLKSSI